MKTIGGVRRGQLITTYGVGAIVAVGDESVMVAGLDIWPSGGDEVLEPRLFIKGKSLRLPPGGGSSFGGGDRGHIPVVRFPRWHYCPNPPCRRLDSWTNLAHGKKNTCRHCDWAGLVPSRFVAVCEYGHIEDFPYYRWVHPDRSSDGDTQRHDLTLKVSGATTSLAGIDVGCLTCGRTRSMDGAFSKAALVGVKSCGGFRPWLTRDPQDCGKRLRTTQRGASNIWFPTVRSVLSIPPWSDGLQQFVQKHWSYLKLDVPADTTKRVVEGLVSDSGVSHSVEEVLAAVKDRRGEGNSERDEAEIRVEEFRALCQGREGGAGSQFVAEPGDPPSELETEVTLITEVSRLREVRAFTGFSRLVPSTDPEHLAEITLHEDWVPAIPVHGEGVFLRLRDDALAKWEVHDLVKSRTETLRRRWAESFFFEEKTECTPRFLLAHTLAHALIDQWSLAGGYPAAALRERVFSGEEGTGILIYTAGSDSAGSLGGVISQAKPERLAASFDEAVRRYAWCSSDPVCSETSSQGAEGLNLAACHSCALAPETSCEFRNGLLDRAMLVGLPADRSFGFFRNRLDS